MVEAAKFFGSPNFGNNEDFLFESDVKAHLKWSKLDWDNSSDCNSKLRKLCNSLRHWKKKLKPAYSLHNVIVTLYNEASDIKLDIWDIIEAAEKVGPGIKVHAVSQFKNPKYSCLYFLTKEEREMVRDKLKKVVDSNVVFLDWALEDDTTLFKVHRLPFSVDIELIKREVEKYAAIVAEERELLTHLSGRTLPTGKLTFKVKMKAGVTIESVPHLTVISEMDALFTIPGRIPLCINCETLGHISRKCKARFCKVCKKMALKEHVCVGGSGRSYADVARAEVDADPDASFSSDDDDVGPLHVPDQKVVLANKIADMQSLINLQKDETDSLSRYKTKRRREADTLLSDGETNTEINEIPGSFAAADPVALEGKSENEVLDNPCASVHNPLSFEGFSSLAPKEINKRSYSKKDTIIKSGDKKAQKLYDEMFPKDFVFGD